MTDVVYRREEKFTSDYADKRSIELQVTVTGGYPKRFRSTEPLGMCANGYGENCSIASLDSGFWDLLNSDVKIDCDTLAKGLVNLYDVGVLKVKGKMYSFIVYFILILIVLFMSYSHRS